MGFNGDISALWIVQVSAVLGAVLAYQVFRVVWNRTIDRIAHFRGMSPQRVATVRRAVQILGRITLAVVVSLILAIEFQGVLVLLGALSAAIGIAFFAQWSILSNVTTSIIMFWKFPIRIGDHISILGEERSLGKVTDVTPFFIILTAANGNTITIPNNQVLQQSFVVYDSDSSESMREEREGAALPPLC